MNFVSVVQLFVSHKQQGVSGLCSMTDLCRLIYPIKPSSKWNEPKLLKLMKSLQKACDLGYETHASIPTEISRVKNCRFQS